jgi:hypothetical protein
MSVVYGSSTAQEAAMDPDVQNGTRKRFTELDAAAMKDIGWDVIPLAGPSGDYNNNGVVDAADYVAWRDRLNQSITLPNDPTPGSVTNSDYTAWRTNFSRAQGSGTAAALAGVPEPASAAMVLASSIAALFARRQRRG